MKKLKFRLQLVAEDQEGSAEEVVELAVLEKDCERLEYLGLTLSESKEILGTHVRVAAARRSRSLIRAVS